MTNRKIRAADKNQGKDCIQQFRYLEDSKLLVYKIALTSLRICT